MTLDILDTKFLCALRHCAEKLCCFRSITCALPHSAENLEAQEYFLDVIKASLFQP